MRSMAVVGAGPIGSILSAHLLKLGLDVHFVDVFKERMLAVKKEGLKLNDPHRRVIGDFTVLPQKIHYSVGEIGDKPDVIFICTKAYQLMAVVEEISRAFSPPPRVVVFQNGLDNEERAAEVLGPENVLRCVVNYAGMMRSDSEVEVTFFNRPNYLGAMVEEGAAAAWEVAGVLTEAGLETAATEDIKKLEWEKAILNAGLAPVSAVTGLTMKEVMDCVPLRQMVEALLQEGIGVAGASGVEFPPGFEEHCLSYLRKGGRHKPSMLLDLERGGITEIDFLNGRIVEYGEKLGIPVPYNRMITALTKGLEWKKGGQTISPGGRE